MTRVSIAPFACVLLLVSARPGVGATLDFVPASGTAMAGSSFIIDVVISGLGTGGPPSVSAFDLMVAFDRNVLRATGISFGAFLGDPSNVEAITDFDILPGSINFAEVSLLLPDVLDALQPGSFSLATLTFEAVNPGMTTLRFVPGTVPGVPGLDVSDAFGDVLSVSASDASFDVVVPEPTAVLFIPAGLTLMALVARNTRARDGGFVGPGRPPRSN